MPDQKYSFKLTAENIELVRAVKESRDQIERLAKSTETLQSRASSLLAPFAGLKSALVGLVSLGGFVSLVRSLGATSDQLINVHNRTGLSVEQLSALKIVADSSGASLASLARGLSILNRNMFAAETGNKKLAAVFSKLGVDLRGGVEPAMLRIADVIHNTGEESDKAKILLTLLGKSGDQLVEFFDQGAASIQKATGRIKELGGVIDEVTARQIDEFLDALAAIGSAALATAAKIAGPLAQSISRAFRLGGGIRDVAPSIDQMRAKLKQLTDEIAHLRSTENITEGGFFESLGLTTAAGAALRNIDRIKDLSLEIATYERKIEEAERATRESADANREQAGTIEGLVDAIGKEDRATQKVAASKGALRAARESEKRIIDQENAALKEQQSILDDIASRAGSVVSRLRRPEEQADISLAADRAALEDAALANIDIGMPLSEALERLEQEHAETMRKIFDPEVTRDFADQSKTYLQEISTAVTDFSRSASDAFVDFAKSGSISFSQLISSILDDLARLTARKAFEELFGLLASAAGSAIAGLGSAPVVSSGSQSLVSAGGPGVAPIFQARAAGGPVSAGRPYIVGERGPELFVPRQAGSIAAGTGGVVVNVNNYSGSAVETTERADRGQLTIDMVIGLARGAARDEMITQRRSGGLLGA